MSILKSDHRFLQFPVCNINRQEMDRLVNNKIIMIHHVSVRLSTCPFDFLNIFLLLENYIFIINVWTQVDSIEIVDNNLSFY